VYLKTDMLLEVQRKKSTN